MEKNKKVFLLLNIVLFCLCGMWIVLGFLQEKKTSVLIGAGVLGLLIVSFIVLNSIKKKNCFLLNMAYVSAIFLFCHILNMLYYGNKIISIFTMVMFAVFLLTVNIKNLCVLTKRFSDPQKPE